MASFGDRLRKEREQRGISLDDVALSTKIGTRMLRALEEEKFDQLPGGIFNKGFVRAYARHVGINEDQAIADYLEAAGEAQAEPQPSKPGMQPAKPARSAEELVTARPPAFYEDTDRKSGTDIPWGVLAVLLLTVAVGLSVWSSYSRRRENNAAAASPMVNQPHSAPPTSSASGVPAQSGQKPAAQPDTPPAQNSSSPQAPSSPGPNGPGSSLVNPIALPKVSLAVGTSSTQDTPSAPASAIPVGSFVVLIRATSDCWLSIIADGRLILEGTLAASGEKTVRAQRQLVIKAGNAGGVEFIFNGKKLPPQGGDAEVKTLTFDADGLQPTTSGPPD